MVEWSDPGVEEVAPDIHRIPLPLPNDGLRAVNVYALTGPDGLVLIDSGWALTEAEDLLAAGLATLGAGFGDVRRFLVTHAHRDHYTQAITLRRKAGMPISLGQGEKPSLDVLTDDMHRALSNQRRSMRFFGATDIADKLDRLADAKLPDDDPFVWEMPDDWLVEGDRVRAGGRDLAVVETPGHTEGHVVFHDAANVLLFAGDHVLPRITPSIGLQPAPFANPLGAFLGSLAKVRAMPDARLLPAHGPVADSVHARVDELIAHHGRRLEQTRAAMGDGATPFEVAGRLRWTRREHRLADLDLFNAMLAIGETAAHLDLLVAQGSVALDRNGVYTPA